MYDRHSSCGTSLYMLDFWFCYENEFVIWLSEARQRDSFHKASIGKKNKPGNVTGLGTILPYCIAYCMAERCLKNRRDPTVTLTISLTYWHTPSPLPLKMPAGRWPQKNWWRKAGVYTPSCPQKSCFWPAIPSNYSLAQKYWFSKEFKHAPKIKQFN